MLKGKMAEMNGWKLNGIKMGDVKDKRNKYKERKAQEAAITENHYCSKKTQLPNLNLW